MTSTATEVKWIGSGPTRRKSMEPWIKDSVDYYPHQIEAIRKLARTPPSFILADEMGLGKSLQALTIFAVDVARDLVKSALVVCPTTLKGNWADEIQKFTGFEFMVLQGSPRVREVQLDEFALISGPKILIINYEQAIPHVDRLNQIGFDEVIFDEAHYLKNPKAKRTKAALEILSKRSMMLTGTPLLNRVNELWSLLHRCKPTQFRSYYSFTHRYCMFGGYKDKQIVGTKNEAELRSHLGQYMTQRFKKDVLDLPDIQVIERRVDLLAEQRKIYDEIKNDLKVTIAGEDSPQDVENALTKFLRLKQVCGTTAPFNGADISAKLDLAVEDMDLVLQQGHRVVVFTQFRDVQACAVDRLKAMGYDTWGLHGGVNIQARPEIVKEWGSTTKPGALVCMIQVAGVGLNMTQSSHLFLLDKLFTPGLNRQAVDRLHRIGADGTRPVQVFEYICRKTIENRVNQILNIKTKLEHDILQGDVDPDFRKKILEAMMGDLSE